MNRDDQHDKTYRDLWEAGAEQRQAKADAHADEPITRRKLLEAIASVVQQCEAVGNAHGDAHASMFRALAEELK